MDIELDTPETVKPEVPNAPKVERQNLDLTEGEFCKRLPSTSKLAYGSLQKNRLEESIARSRIPAVADFIRLSGFKGELTTILQGLSITVKAGMNTHIVASPEFEEQVSKAYKKPFEVLESALAAGVAVKKESKDFNIVFHKPTTKDTPKNNSLIEKLLENSSDKKVELSSSTISRDYPTLISSIHCQIQRKRLEIGIKKTRGKAQHELNEYPDTNINTSVNNQSVRISTFNKSPIEILPGNPEWSKKLSKAQKEAAKELKELLLAGKAKEEKTYYLQVSLGANTKTPKIKQPK